MELGQYLAEVQSGGLLLELPIEAKTLHLKAGDQVRVSVHRPVEPLSNENQLKGRGMLAGVMTSEDFLRRKHEATELEDRRAP